MCVCICVCLFLCAHVCASVCNIYFIFLLINYFLYYYLFICDGRCVSSASLSSSLEGEGSLGLASPVKRGIDPVGSWLLKKRLGSSSNVYGSQSHNWPIGGGAAHLASRQDEEDSLEEDREEGGPMKRRIDPVGSYLLRKRVIDPVGSYLLKRKGDRYASLRSEMDE